MVAGLPRRLIMKKKGFTIIELLVVVAIINIVAALLLSSLRSSREKARFATCINNQRNLTGSLIMYAMDNATFPNDLTAWLHQEGHYYAQNSSFWQVQERAYANTPVSTQAYFDGMFYEFKCPESKYSDKYQGVDYGMNQILNNIPYSAINNPEKIIVTTDAFNSYSIAYPDNIDFRHHGGAVAGFVDGHVEWVKPGSLYQYNGGGVGYALNINDIDMNFNNVPDYLEVAPDPDTSGNNENSSDSNSQTGNDGNNLNGNDAGDSNSSNNTESDQTSDNLTATETPPVVTETPAILPESAPPVYSTPAETPSVSSDPTPAPAETPPASSDPTSTPSSDPTNSNNGHGNNEDGVDYSNPGQAKFMVYDASAPVDDEGHGGGAYPSGTTDEWDSTSGSSIPEPVDLEFQNDVIATNNFMWNFLGLVDNGNGTSTLSFAFTNNNNKALSYVAFALPAGVTAITDTDTYISGTNQYKIQNGVSQPFYGIRFDSIGTGIKSGSTSTFSFTLQNADIANIQSMEVKAKATSYIGDGVYEVIES